MAPRQNDRMDDISRVLKWLATPAVLAALQETFLGVEPEGLPDAAQGDMQGPEFKGGIEEAVQADIQEFEFFQEGGLTEVVLLLLLLVQVAGQMLGVAAEGGGAEAELPGQGAIGQPLDEAAVDLRAGGVGTDGTAHQRDAGATRLLHHNCAPREKFPGDAGWISGYQGRGEWASTGRTVGSEPVKVPKESLG